MAVLRMRTLRSCMARSLRARALSPTSSRAPHVAEANGCFVAFDPIHVGMTPSLLFHASGALTFLTGEGEPPAWDDEPVFVTVA
jgi:hypothetical protein